jgi:hypothetical protein
MVSRAPESANFDDLHLEAFKSLGEHRRCAELGAVWGEISSRKLGLNVDSYPLYRLAAPDLLTDANSQYIPDKIRPKQSIRSVPLSL